MRKASTGLRVKQCLPLSPPQPRQLKNPEFPAPNNKSDLILTHNKADTQGRKHFNRVPVERGKRRNTPRATLFLLTHRRAIRKPLAS